MVWQKEKAVEQLNHTIEEAETEAAKPVEAFRLSDTPQQHR